jgi:hypothetical protein
LLPAGSWQQLGLTLLDVVNTLIYLSPLCCKYNLMDWVTVKTHKNSNESIETKERYK